MHPIDDSCSNLTLPSLELLALWVILPCQPPFLRCGAAESETRGVPLPRPLSIPLIDASSALATSGSVRRCNGPLGGPCKIATRERIPAARMDLSPQVRRGMGPERHGRTRARSPTGALSGRGRRLQPLSQCRPVQAAACGPFRYCELSTRPNGPPTMLILHASGRHGRDARAVEDGLTLPLSAL